MGGEPTVHVHSTEPVHGPGPAPLGLPHHLRPWGPACVLGGALAFFFLAQVSDAKELLYSHLTQGGIAPFPGVGELVAAAAAAGLGVALASSGTPEKIHHNLTSSGLLGLFADERLVRTRQGGRVCGGSRQRPAGPVWWQAPGEGLGVLAGLGRAGWGEGDRH